MNPQTQSQPIRWRWLAFAAAVAASVMDLLDATVVQVAAPSIRHDIGGSYAVIQWIAAAYTLAMAVGLLTGGRLGDLYGRKRMLLIGIAAFIVTSAACAVASTPAEMIAARAAQGAAGSMMLPQVFGLIRDLFGPEEMGKAFGVYGPAMGLSAMLGPIVAGGLISANLLDTGWRMIFLVNLPVGLAALLVGHRFLPDAPPAAKRERLDVTGMVLAGAVMLLLVFPLVEGHDLGWPLWIVGLLVAAVPALALFGAHQLRRKRAGRTPLIEPSIFRRGPYVSAIVFSLVFVGALGGVVLILGVLLQAGLGFSPWHSAITTAPWAAGAFVGSGIGGVAMNKLGRKILHAGLVVEVVGLLGLYVVLRGAGEHVGSVDLLAPMIVGGFGMGMVFVPLFDIIMAGVAPHEMGSASGVLQAANSMAMSLGVAGVGAIFFALVGSGGVRQFLAAGEWTALVTVALLVVAFVLAFRLPARARVLTPEGDAAPGTADAAPATTTLEPVPAI
ncbi:MAG: MFS transporter [Solirubrobacteraceae bacterium]